MKQTGKRVTIKEVAEDAQVSVAAVSKVLRNSYGVSAKMRERVEASMRKLDYRPHTAARGMRGKTYTIGILQNDLRNPYLPNIFDGVIEGLEGTGYQPLLGVGQSQVPLESALINSMIDRQMDGLIMIAPRLPEPELERIARQIPTCVIAYHHDQETAFDTANFDSHLGARMATKHLLAQGSRNPVMLSLALPESDATNVIRQRELGFMAELEAHGIETENRVTYSHFDEARTQQVIHDLLNSSEPPDGLFCWSDIVALDTFTVAESLNIRVPEALAVVGYDNTFDQRLRPFGLSSLNQSGHRLGSEAARLLLERIGGRTKAEHSLFRPELIVRGSSAT
ncbi:LacI family transcriptional regulator [Natronospirillum operosum]|uniref:LacI family transcriptional regulator n=1 Tax=Natronospirillum operosum TaxID=2759953 RepID=A0A4Z0WEY1_9GAMM|nr:LacI family DNA-binding transcriptional regulator [Natronospirillum operosum]TGG93501.1 LacI family transcriptional regulator [Natronospirillum operosum]